MYESEKIEFKEMFTDKIYREVIAFANSDGGVILIGVDDKGNAVGIDDIYDTYNRITNGIRDIIMPDVTMCIRYTLKSDNTIEIEINEGSLKPYYIRSKGMTPSGVFVRQGASSAPASWEQIRQFIKTSDGVSFEESRSLNQELTFHQVSAEFQKKAVPFDESKYVSLGLKNAVSGLYTGLGLLISDQCEHSIKIAVFDDINATVFRDRKEFSGSVFNQLYDAFNYLMLCNQTKSIIKGLERYDNRDYPDEAVREALLNAITHRDYSFSGSIIINVCNDRMEFISIGSLPPGLSETDIRAGISQPRNKNLANIFYRLRHIEAYGTGIRRIFNLYADYPVQPKIIITENTFTIILPNMNSSIDIYNHLSDLNNTTLSLQEKNIIEYLQLHESAADEDIQSLIDVKRTRAYVIIKKLIDMGIIKAVGYGKGKKYTLK
jgi:Predicted transcriptional regulator containing an HTH domain and an uncharacterized domain shared with the mammalian protein Schlafen